MNNWVVVVKPSPLGEIDIQTFVDKPTRVVAGYTRVITEAISRHIRQRAKLDARHDAARKAKRKTYKAILKKK